MTCRIEFEAPNVLMLHDEMMRALDGSSGMARMKERAFADGRLAAEIGENDDWAADAIRDAITLIDDAYLGKIKDLTGNPNLEGISNLLCRLLAIRTK